MKPTPLVIDVQHFVLDMYPGYSDSVKKHAKTMNDAIVLFRQKGLPLVVIHHEDRGLGPRSGMRAFAFHESIDVRDSDPRVVKNYPNGFNKTPLAEMLRKMSCDNVFIVGLSAVGCAIATTTAP